MAKLTLAQLERHLFAAADVLRGTMDAAEYRDFLLALLFLKRANDEFESARERITEEEKADGSGPEEIRELVEMPESYTRLGVLFVPRLSRWERLAGAVTDIATQYLDVALDKLVDQEATGRLRGLFHHVNFTRIGGGAGGGGARANQLADERLKALIGHFGSLRLRSEDLEFPDVIGAAYEYLLKEFADSAGAKGGEFYTPRAVVRMMVELAEPTERSRVYDPCVGSGGMLTHAMEYVEEHGGDAQKMALAGQDSNSGSWVMATMNMLFHGAKPGQFDLRTGDTLAAPGHLDKGPYDIVLSNPPFSMDYKADDIPDLAERMPYGETSERGKADLMFLQHMLYMVRDSAGSVFTVMPHGVLFRGGAEQRIRAELVREGVLEAVIGLAPNLFYGTGIPACVLVLNPSGPKKAERQGKVLFVNADREFHAERAQNVLLPEHVEKIVTAFRDFSDIEGFSRAVRVEELEENDYNLNIRRYVDNTPPPEPQDVRAHLVGGVPRAEIEARKPLLDAYGVALTRLFAERDGDPDYVDFLPEGRRPDAETLTGLAEARERVLWETFETWWAQETEQIASLAPYEGDDRTEAERRGRLARLRAELIKSFRTRLLGVGLLDTHALAGAIAGWWQDARNDLKALSTQGFGGVVDGWVETVETMLEPEPNPWTGGARNRTSAERRQAYDHKVVARIAPGFLRDLAEADRVKADLDAKLKAAEAPPSGADSESAEEEASAAPLLSGDDLKRLKKERTAAAKAVKELEHDFWPLERTPRRGAKAVVRAADVDGQTALAVDTDGSAPPSAASKADSGLYRSRDALDDDGRRAVVLGILRDDLASKLEGHLVRRRREMIEAYRRWEDKYAVSLRDIEKRREAAGARLDEVLGGLGYVG